MRFESAYVKSGSWAYIPLELVLDTNYQFSNGDLINGYIWQKGKKEGCGRGRNPYVKKKS